MNLSTELLNHVIIFHDKSIKFITEAQSNIIFQSSTSEAKSITTPSLGMIVFSSIAKIISIEYYYEQYPDKRPTENLKEFIPPPRAEYKTLEEAGLASNKRRQQMIRGISEYIEEAEMRKENPVNAKAILERWINHKGQEDDSITSYHRKTVEKYKDIKRNDSEEVHYQHAVNYLAKIDSLTQRI